MQDKKAMEVTSLERRLTIDDAIKARSIQAISREIGEMNVIKAITGALMLTGEYFNTSTPLSESQAIQTASLLLDQYGTESLEDILLCLRNAKTGQYGTVYNRFDGLVVFEWFARYLDQKYERLEQIKHNQQMEQSQIAPDITQAISQALERAAKEKGEKLKEVATYEKHLTHFKASIIDLNQAELEQVKKVYLKENKGCLEPQFDDYIKAVDYQLEHANAV